MCPRSRRRLPLPPPCLYCPGPMRKRPPPTQCRRQPQGFRPNCTVVRRDGDKTAHLRSVPTPLKSGDCNDIAQFVGTSGATPRLKRFGRKSSTSEGPATTIAAVAAAIAAASEARIPPGTASPTRIFRRNEHTDDAAFSDDSSAKET